MGKIRKNTLFSLLKTLNPKKVDLRFSGINSLHQFADLHVEELDIRNRSIKNLSGLKSNYLKVLIISKGQFTPGQLALLSKSVKTVVK
ncbi:MAG: hypothetical protein HRT88_06005 [Lentisphaeraceae bacterium]|nr:hypothetical protein [Lentisphaeraceae bacterium]